MSGKFHGDVFKVMSAVSLPWLTEMTPFPIPAFLRNLASDSINSIARTGINLGSGWILAVFGHDLWSPGA